ncbi:NAD(P)H-dependent oxidoreductase [Paenibacillus sp. SN-8-1]|uniref:NAD(P)H-dependent oxidoreductase n=1 Tax=Paenibacillus sp. SN-8-1 TaxID=3435409 RepID=UPI003D9A7DA4
MRILVVAAHPNIEQSRVNQRWLAELRGYPNQITFHELYKAYPGFAIDADKFYGAVKAKDDQINHSASSYVEHITSPDLNPIIVRNRMLAEMSKNYSN